MGALWRSTYESDSLQEDLEQLFGFRERNCMLTREGAPSLLWNILP